MEELSSLLLPLWLLVMAGEAVLPEGSRSADRFARILGGGILLLSAGVAFIRGPLTFHGPALFVLDSFHQIRFQIQADWLLLGILAAFLGISASEESSDRSSSDRLLSITVVLFVLADNFGLQVLAGGAICALLVFEQIRRTKTAAINAGLGLFAMLFLLLCLGLLAFDLALDSWSGLGTALIANENWTAYEISSLKLASFFLVFSSIILAGLAPFQSLWSTSDRGVQKFHVREIVRFLLASGLLARGRGLLIWAATGEFAVSLAFVTFVLTAFCAPFQLKSQNIVRTLIASHLALAMTGLLAADDIVFAAGVCHIIVSYGLWSLLSDENSLRSRLTLALVFLIPFGGLSGAFLLLHTATQGEIGVELIGLLAWMSLGLTQMQFLRFERSSPKMKLETAPTTNSSLLRLAVAVGAVVVLWCYSSTSMGFVSAIDRVWLIPEVILAGVTGIAIGWSVGCSKPLGDRLAVRTPGLSRIFERQFYLNELVRGTVRIPGGICLTGYLWVRETVLLTVRWWREFRKRRDVSHEESVRWELLRGAVCAAVLLIVFLWMGRG